MVAGTGKFYHFFYPGPVLRRLEGIGLKVLFISLKIKGECVQYLSLLLQFSGTDSCNQRTVYAPERKVQIGISESI